MSEEKHDRPRQEASDPGRGQAPGDEVEPGTQGAAEVRSMCHAGTSCRVTRRSLELEKETS